MRAKKVSKIRYSLATQVKFHAKLVRWPPGILIESQKEQIQERKKRRSQGKAKAARAHTKAQRLSGLPVSPPSDPNFSLLSLQATPPIPASIHP